jgi:mannose-6-phosphate isomerase
MSMLEPLFFTPLFRSYLWGGRRLETVLHKALPDAGQWAESWEIVDRGTDQSQVADGRWAGYSLRQLIERMPESILGSDAQARHGFPLLLKYLDCQRVLSVQVHPDDAYAKQMAKPDLGKTEAWYVLEAMPGAVVYAGLKPGVDRASLAQAMAAGRTEECLHQFQPEAGDCIFIPAGTVHALGAGLIVAEIQQSSDTTFRLFDWNRLGDDGRSRPLHIAEALEVSDFARGPVNVAPASRQSGDEDVVLVDCPQFRLLKRRRSATLASDGDFRILTVVAGSARLHWPSGQRDLPRGGSTLLPAACCDVELDLAPQSAVLQATVPRVAG